MENELSTLAAAARRRRRRAAAWTAACLVPAAAILLIAWEGVVGPFSPWRPAGYAVAAGVLLAGVVGIVRRRDPGPTGEEIARRVDRLFPQTRGGVAELDAPARGSLAEERRAAIRGWMSKRGHARLDMALGEVETRAARRRRGIALGLIVLVALAFLGFPGAARRVTAALGSPTSIWRAPGVAWRIVPGDVLVEPGAPLAGTARYAGPAVEAALLLERRSPTAVWSAETLGPGPTGAWRWDAVAAETEYRLRYGPFTSPVHRVSVRTPLGIVRFEGRQPGGAWQPMAGRTVPGGTRLELRGESSRRLEAASLEVGDRELDLEIEGRSFRGTVMPPPGSARVRLRSVSGVAVFGEPFLVSAEGAPWVDIVLPSEDPAVLTAVRAWVEARAGSAAGLGEVRWETDAGRDGPLGDPAGARDTTLSGSVPLALETAPGETLRYRVVAVNVAGERASTPWRTAIVADRERLAAEAREGRQAAAEHMADAIAEARAERRPRAAGPAHGSGERVGDGSDERLRRAADSLASALQRTLADPGLPPDLAERMEGYRRLLEGTSRAQLAPPPGALPHPRTEAAARASVLEAIRRGLAEVDSLLAVEAGADSLARLADAESRLAERSRRASAEEISGDIASRQDALAESAREAASALPDRLEEAVAEALEGAAEGVRSGDPARAADAQKEAAAGLSRAAAQAQASLGPGGVEEARNRAALDRAGGQVLFLAEREQALVERMEIHAADPAEHAARIARQRVVTGGLERALNTLVETIGGRPAAADLAERLNEAVYLTRVAEERVAGSPAAVPGVEGATAAAAAADALARLARSLLLPAGGGSTAAGSGRATGSGTSPAAAAAELRALAAAERALADALAPGSSGTGGNPDAATGQREIGRRLEDLTDPLVEAGMDPEALRALEEAVAGVAGRLERGLPGARMESELRTLSRRFADLGRMVDRTAGERRRSRTAGPFLPEHPPELPRRVTAPLLDPEATLAPWRESLPAAAIEPGRAYLERLAEEGIRRPEESR